MARSTSLTAEDAIISEREVPAIQMEGLTKRYGTSILALDKLSLTVSPGEILGFLGPNGAGKTTAIRLLLDLIRPTAGRAKVFGLDCQRGSLEVRRRVGYLPGDLSLYRGMTGHRFLRLFSQFRPGAVSWAYVESLSERLGISLDQPLDQLSRGNRQKIGLAQALMHRPDLLILDEPTAGLDPIAQHQLLEILGEVRSEGRTVFFSSHALAEVEQICDRVAIIRQGRLVTVDEVAALRAKRIRQLTITFGAPVPRDTFANVPGVRVQEQAGPIVHLEVSGDVDRVVKLAAQHHVVSLEAIQPSLEEVFLSYYNTGEEEHARSEVSGG